MRPHVAGTTRHASQVLYYFTLTTNLGYFQIHFTNGEAEEQRGYARCPKSQSQELEPGLAPLGIVLALKGASRH